MAKSTENAPETAGAQGLNSVGDAFQALNAEQRRSIIAGHLTTEDAPPAEEPRGDEPTAPSDLSQEEEAKPDEETPQEPDADDAEEDSDETEEQPPKIDERTQEHIDKRINKEIARRKAAEEKLAEAQARMAELEAAPARIDSVPGDILSADPDVKRHRENLGKCDAALSEIGGLLGQVDENPEQVAAHLRAANIPVNSVESDALRSQLVGLRDHFGRARDDARMDMKFAEQGALNRQREVLGQSFSAATIAFPWLKDAKSDGYKRAMRLIKDAPWLKLLSDPWQKIGTQVEGEILMDTRKATKPGKTKDVKVPKIPTPKSAPTMDRRTEPQVTAEQREKALLGGDKKARLAIIDNMLKQPTARR